MSGDKVNGKPCNLNRKPYYDRNGLLRERVPSQCCGKRECLIDDGKKQPVGMLVTDHDGNAIYKMDREKNKRKITKEERETRKPWSRKK